MYEWGFGYETYLYGNFWFTPTGSLNNGGKKLIMS